MLPKQRAKKKNDRHARLPFRFEWRLLVSILFSGIAGVILSLLLLWTGGFSLDHKLEGSILVLLLWLAFSFSARNAVVNSLRVLSNVVSALKEEDYSVLATHAVAGDVLGELAMEINSLSRALAAEKLGAMETTNLLRKIMTDTGTIIFVLSPDRRLQLVNRAGAVWLGKREEELVNRTVRELGIEHLVQGGATQIISRVDSGVEKRWILRRSNFRQRGEVHWLMVLSEASAALRAEEHLAWHRLIRVLSHEINNSLAPIKTIARTLGRVCSKTPLPAPLSEHLHHGLEVVHDRSESLIRFLQNYTRAATVPPPARRRVTINSLIYRVAALESRLGIHVVPGPEVEINIDPDQIEQVVINLIKNAVDSVLLAGRPVSADAVTISWTDVYKDMEIYIRDEGVGLTQTENLFVPFYTTKQDGSGIGLFLSRQIIEGHQGMLVLRNRNDRQGCEVQIKLPECIVGAP